MRKGRIIGVLAGSLLAGSVVGPCYGLYSGNEFFFPKALRLICLGVRMFSNTQISFDEAYGSIKDGRVKVRDMKIRSFGNTSKDIDIQINSVEGDMEQNSLLF